MDPVIDLVESVRSKRIKLWVENNCLRYRAPKGALTEEVTEALRSSRDQILLSEAGRTLIARIVRAVPDTVSNVQDVYPLTLSRKGILSPLGSARKGALAGSAW